MTNQTEDEGARGSWEARWIAALTVILALAFVGSGPVNGDAAVYAVQAAQGDLTERTVHLAYLIVAAGLGRIAGGHLPLALDVWSALCGGLAILALARIAAGREGIAVVAAAATGAMLLPWMAFAEVDPQWFAAAIWAVCVPGRWAWVLLALAVWTSPVALVVLPLALFLRDDRDARAWLWVAFGAVLAVSLSSGGDWWVGDRGVLQGPGPRVGRTAREVLLGLWWAWPVLLPMAWRRPSLALRALPLLLLPPDVPGWWMLGAVGAVELSVLARSWARLVPAWVVLAAFAGALSLTERARHTVEVNARLARAVELLPPDAGWVSPWHLGVRASILACGDPYCARWTTPEGVRDQRERWCADPPVSSGSLSDEGLSWSATDTGRRFRCEP